MPASQNPRKVLILSFQNFTGISHLPKCLTQAGFMVSAICTKNSYLASTRFLHKKYFLPPYFLYWNIRRLFYEIVEDAAPDLLIPGDDTALAFLQNLYLQRPAGETTSLSNLIEKSLGDPAYYGVCTDKLAFGKLCARLGLNTPEQYSAQSIKEVMEQASHVGYPVVFKKTLSSGGAGVEICNTEEELQKQACGFFGTGAVPLSARIFWEIHMARGLDNRHLMRPQEDSILVQEFIPGRVLSHTFVCDEGQYLSGYTYENLNSAENSKHPCRQLQILDVQYDCEEVARLLAGELKLNGFACIDFIRDHSGKLFVLECNARTTHTVVLGEKVGLNLAKLLFKKREQDTGMVLEGHYSLFPDGMREKPDTFDARNSVVPWDDPELLCALMKDPRPAALSKKWLAGLPVPWLKNQWLSYRNRHLVFRTPPQKQSAKKQGAMA